MRAALPILLLAALSLSACTTITPEERRAIDEATCRDYGFRPRTEAFAECLQKIDLSRRADRRARLYGDPGYSGGIGVGIGYGRVWW